MSLLRPSRPQPPNSQSRSEAGWHGITALHPREPSLIERLRNLLRPTARLVRRFWQSWSGQASARQLDALLLAHDDLVTGMRRLMRERAIGWAPPSDLALPHLVWVSSWQTRCGIAEYSRHLLGAMQAQHAWHITVLNDDRPSLPQIVPMLGVTARPVFRVGEMSSVGRLALGIAAADPDCVVIQHHAGLMPWPMLADLLLHPLLAARRIVVVLHNTTELLQLSRRLQARMQLALRGADLVLVHTARDIGLLNTFGLSHVRGIAHGCLGGGAAPLPRLLPPHTTPVIGCTGFLMPHKGVQKLIRAVSSLRTTWPGLRLRLVMARYPGSASAAELRACQALARSLRFEDHIDWHTEFLPEEEAVALLRDCDLLVLPTLRSGESSSASARLALASGVPVLVSDLPIFDDLSDAVARFNEANPGGLAGQISDWLHAPLRRAHLQNQADAWRREHDVALVAEKLGGILDNLPVAK